MEAKLAQLKLTHQLITKTIQEIEQYKRLYPKVKPYLRQLLTQVLSFLSYQSEEFYSTIQNFYHLKENNLKIIEFLKEDLKNIKVQYLIFADQHSGQMSDVKDANFVGQFNEFSALLLARFKLEEDYLFPLIQEFN